MNCAPMALRFFDMMKHDAIRMKRSVLFEQMEQQVVGRM
jgi:hypothetical protein